VTAEEKKRLTARQVIRLFMLRREYCTHSWREVTGYRDQLRDGYFRVRVPRQLRQCRWCQKCVPLTLPASSG
jgi:hypothetical protein